MRDQPPIITPTCWAAEIDGAMLLAPESEAEAVETWEVGEFELGLTVIIYRGYATLPRPLLSSDRSGPIIG